MDVLLALVANSERLRHVRAVRTDDNITNFPHRQGLAGLSSVTGENYSTNYSDRMQQDFADVSAVIAQKGTSLDSFVPSDRKVTSDKSRRKSALLFFAGGTLFDPQVYGRGKRLDIFPYGNILQVMARAATTTDVFNAIAEPRRRQILGVLGDGKQHAVGEVVEALQLPQPAVSKHLRVLLSVGVVQVSRHGQLRRYRLNAKELKPVHDWVTTYARYWMRQLHKIKERSERKMMDRIARENLAPRPRTGVPPSTPTKEK